MTEITPRALLIAGMHRSGTSLAAALLQSSGVHIGERLLGPSPSNLRGHFENLDFVEVHQSILRSRGLDENGWTVGDPVSFDEATEEEARRLIRTSQVSPFRSTAGHRSSTARFSRIRASPSTWRVPPSRMAVYAARRW